MGFVFDDSIYQSYIFGTDEAIEVPNYNVSLLHFNGADGSTQFTDEYGHVWSIGGGAIIDTAEKQFGTASMLNGDGSQDYITTPDSADFTLGADDFTVEMWIKRNSIANIVNICGQSNSSRDAASRSVLIHSNSDETVRFQITSGSSNYIVNSVNTVINDGSWHHIAGVRDGNNLKVFIDGNHEASKDVTGITVNDSTASWAIGTFGNYTGGAEFDGWFDEFRFSKGIARYTTNFTPSTGEFST